MADHPFVTAYKAERTPATARVLPDNAIVSILGSSTSYGGYTFDYAYETISAWVQDRLRATYPAVLDLVTAQAGEILVIPKGIEHTETNATFVELNCCPLENTRDNNTYFAVVMGEDPEDKPTVNLVNVCLSNGSGSNPAQYSRLYDFNVTYSGTHTGTAIHYPLHMLGPNSDAVGIIVGEVAGESAWGLTVAALFNEHGASWKDCAIVGPITEVNESLISTYNTVAVWISVSGLDSGVSSFSQSNITVSAVVPVSYMVSIVDYTESPITILVKNCIARNFTVASFLITGNQAAQGSFYYVTCDVADAVSIDEDGYTITASDGNGTAFDGKAVSVTASLGTGSGLPAGTPLKVEFYEWDGSAPKGALLDTSDTHNMLDEVSYSFTFTGRAESHTEDYYCATVYYDLGAGWQVAYEGCADEGALTGGYLTAYDDDIIGQGFGGEDGDEAWDRGAMAYYGTEEPEEPENVAPITPYNYFPENGSYFISRNPVNATISITAYDEDRDNLTVRFYNGETNALLGTDTVVSSGTAATSWPNLPLDATYTWYPTVSDGTVTVTGTVHTFYTEAAILPHMNFANLSPSSAWDDNFKDGNYGAYRAQIARGLGKDQDKSKREGAWAEKIENPVSRAEKDNVVPSKTTRNNSFSDATISNPAGQDLTSDGVAVPSASNVAKDVGKKPNRWGF